jgi:hypothetical protein
MSATSTARDYLSDPNYYRLRYQLAAQLLNWHASLTAADVDPEAERVDRFNILYGEGSVEQKGEPSSEERSAELGLAARGEAQASRLSGEAKGTLATYLARRLELELEATHGWFSRSLRIILRRRPAPLSLADERLEVFLAGTVDPCAQILQAGAALYQGRPWDGDLVVEELGLRDAGSLSYRVHYNAACYWAARAQQQEDETEAFLRRSLDALRDALRICPTRRREELLDWLGNDPTLVQLRVDPRVKDAFDEEVGRYSIPQEEPKEEPKDEDFD